MKLKFDINHILVLLTIIIVLGVWVVTLSASEDKQKVIQLTEELAVITKQISPPDTCPAPYEDVYVTHYGYKCGAFVIRADTVSEFGDCLIWKNDSLFVIDKRNCEN